MDDLYSELNEQRLLIFLEDEPQSNKYRQVIVDPENFKQISGLLGKIIKIDEQGLEHRELQESEELYTLPDLPSYKF